MRRRRNAGAIAFIAVASVAGATSPRRVRWRRAVAARRSSDVTTPRGAADGTRGACIDAWMRYSADAPIESAKSASRAENAEARESCALAAAAAAPTPDKNASRVSIRFVNHSPRTLRLAWADENGDLRHQRTVPPGRGPQAVLDGSVRA
mmetsp:Transcript_21122/g.64966  ORF Transcript_21122/g.64966 Transcript_21122/m.64966 type:complete len:150 (-) Transcript_21122:1011-1460(-)